MKNTLVILLISMSTSISAQLIEDTPLITTNGTAIVYAEPDEVLFSYTIITEGDDLVDARNQNATISKGTI
ncbi:MAG: SIMPL domain-containing protein, partial [Flavobacteriales bacterium]|nr:SIMPL domain-containing protein [Flavobacteriales bacterium]